MSIFFQEKSLEKNRYYSDFGLDIERAEAFEAIQADELVDYFPHVVEWFVTVGAVRDTYEINPDTKDDVWKVMSHSGIELQIVVFENEEQKQLYLRNKKHQP